MTRKNESNRKTAFGGLFGSSGGYTMPKDRAREYIIHRIEDGGHLESVMEEPYVQRNCNRAQIDEIVKDPRLIHAAHESMTNTFSSGQLDPKPSL